MQAARDVYFPIEIASREYSGHLLLAVELASRGFTAVVGYKGAVSRALASASHPGVLFYKNYRKSRWSEFVRYSVGQDPEAGITYTNFADFFAWRSGLQAGETSDAYFCFGQNDFDFLRTAIPGANLHLTGSPRATLWGNAGKTFHARRIAEIREHYGDFVLFANSGGRGNPRLEAHRMAGRLTPEMEVHLAENLHTADEMAAAAFAVAAELGKQVVVRPHPVEDWAAWKRAVSGFEGVNVESCFDLSPWVHAAEAVVHFTSTAALEAFSAGTPAIAFAPTEQEFVDGYLARLVSVPNDISIKAAGLPMLLSVLDNLATEQAKFLEDGRAEEIMRSRIHEPTGGAAAAMASVITEVGDFGQRSGITIPRISRWRFPRIKSDDRAVPGVADGLRPQFKRRPITRQEIEADVEAALVVLGRAPGTVAPLLLERDCFAISGVG